MTQILLSLFSGLFLIKSYAASAKTPVLADLNTLKKLELPYLQSEPRLNLAYAHLNSEDLQRISDYNHDHGKCGGYEELPSFSAALQMSSQFQALLEQDVRNKAWSQLLIKPHLLRKKIQIDQALLQLEVENLRADVTWLSSFPTRDNRSREPNLHVYELEARLKESLSSYPWARVDLISHSRTEQKSIRVHLEGQERPSEIVVLGGHLDSISRSWGSNKAPGADDNASGSSNLLEALRVLLLQGQPQRSLEFFWYAGEESGLLGSAEIAQTYKEQSKNVVAVLQLDMTLFPGSGELTIASMTDFTSSWLRDFLKESNELYIGAHLVEDRCGYGCSDHASWHRQGYPTLMPFEAQMRMSNRKIHTSNDIITNQSSFQHSLAFSKIALVFAMELGNSELKQPF